MEKITPTEKVVIEKSVADKVCEAPNESVFVLKVVDGEYAATTTTVLHRTGIDGWLVTRSVSSLRPKRPLSTYVSTDEVRKLLESERFDGIWLLGSANDTN